MAGYAYDSLYVSGFLFPNHGPLWRLPGPQTSPLRILGSNSHQRTTAWVTRRGLAWFAVWLGRHWRGRLRHMYKYIACIYVTRILHKFAHKCASSFAHAWPFCEQLQVVEGLEGALDHGP